MSDEKDFLSCQRKRTTCFHKCKSVNKLNQTDTTLIKKRSYVPRHLQFLELFHKCCSVTLKHPMSQTRKTCFHNYHTHNYIRHAVRGVRSVYHKMTCSDPLRVIQMFFGGTVVGKKKITRLCKLCMVNLINNYFALLEDINCFGTT